MRSLALTLAALTLALPACHKVGPENPRIRVNDQQLNHLRAELKANPVELERPVVVITGLWDPGVGTADIAATLAQLTSGNPDDFIKFRPRTPGTFQESAIELTDAINEQLNEGKPTTRTAEVDVVALSLGGLVARHASIPSVRWIRLDAARIFTLASPHTGAHFAEDFYWVDELIADMAPGSSYLAWLNRRYRSDYELYPYAVKNDPVVGEQYTTPPDWPGEPLWVRGRFYSSHQFIHRDEMILTDIALRLRGEEPLFQEPDAAMPTPSETQARGIETTAP
ncbi:MAG: hypothetical protein AAF297_02320 [Planctomycetota bacterium]